MKIRNWFHASYLPDISHRVGASANATYVCIKNVINSIVTSLNHSLFIKVKFVTKSEEKEILAFLVGFDSKPKFQYRDRPNQNKFQLEQNR